MNIIDNKNKNIALLIDSENISCKYIDSILEELKTYGNITIRRLYGDLTKNNAKPWIEKINTYSLMPVQQFQNTSGKNSSDMAMVIDAMDILYSNHVDVFCIASSDSDFTRLASRIRQDGKYVIGMGESKTPMSLVNSCDSFKYLNIISVNKESSQNSSDNGTNSTESNVTPIKNIESEVISFIESNEGMVDNLTTIKVMLQNKHSDFDIRNYGCSKFSKFLQLFSDKIDLVMINDPIMGAKIK